MVGKTIKVPGTWWKETHVDDMSKTFLCKVVRYRPKFKYATILTGRTSKATWAPVWFIKAPDGPTEFPMCWTDVVSMMDEKDRPIDVNDDEILEPAMLVPAQDEEKEEEEEEGEGAGGTNSSSRERPKGVGKNVYNKDKAKDVAVLEHDGYSAGEVEAFSWVIDAHGVPAKGDANIPPDQRMWKKTADPSWKREKLRGESEEIKLKHVPSRAKLKAGWTVMDSFFLAYPKAARQQAVECTNLYFDIETAAGRKKPKYDGVRFKPATERRFAGYLAVLIFMSLVHLPETSDYWYTGTDRVRCDNVRSIMSSQEWWLWRRFLYFADRRAKVGRGDYSKPPPAGYDILHNWRPMQEHFNEAWLSLVFVTMWLTFDEMMIKCAMQTKLSRRQPNKPIRDGLQSYSVCASKGQYCYVQWIDIGETYVASDPDMRQTMHLGWMVEMVTHVLLKLGLDIEGDYHVVVFDQAFSSPLLFLSLLSVGVYALGTIQNSRRGFPIQQFIDDFAAIGPGQAIHLFSRLCLGILASIWYDKGLVSFVSTYHGSREMLPYQKRKKGHQELVDSTETRERNEYNAHNNGVDLVDQKGSARITDRASKHSPWHRAHQHSLATAITNAFAHYALVVMYAAEEHPDKHYFTEEQVEEVRQFNRKGSRIPKRWRWRLFNELKAFSQESEPTAEGEGTNSRSCKVVHEFGRLGKQSKCARAGCEGRPYQGCQSCDMALCFPKCLDRHINGKCKHKQQRKKKDWLPESDDSDDPDYEEEEQEGSGSGGSGGGSDSDSVSGSGGD
jgi:hypothetical protein